ncbi:hypothetical protein AB0C96_27290 [Streptomyces sp. NPDC048506]|uniref:hypothetical protein n=1 Tax=Streptomyces sp. NPDC048506 TaxID=3155028 RepID=UPI0034368E3A
MRQEGRNVRNPVPLSSAALSKRLLDESDLGQGYVRKPEPLKRHDDVTVNGCPALEKLSGDAALGGSLAFPRKAKASFFYAGSSDSEVSEELYSGTETKLSDGVVLVSPAIRSCGMVLHPVETHGGHHRSRERTSSGSQSA